MQKLSQVIVREYDIRGVVGKNLFIENAYQIGRALGSKALLSNSSEVALGFDGRLSSPEISDQLIKGILDSGCSVINIGLVPTPLLYFALHHLQLDYAIQVTASHNPKEYNGFKIASFKENFFGAELKIFADFVNQGNFLSGQGLERKLDLKNDYLNLLLKELEGIDLSNFSIAWDPACGAAGEIIEALVQKIPANHFLINQKIDGNFPAHEPDPTIEENMAQLKELLLDNRCDIGIAFDGDADRIGVLDDQGEMLYGDQLVILFAKEILARNPRAKIITDIKASKVFNQKIIEYGGVPIIWKTGHSLIKAKMKEESALLAGEMSGHIFFKDGYYGYDDGIFAAVRLLKILAKEKSKISDFRLSLPKIFATKEIKIPCEDERKFKVIEELKSRLNEAGISFIDIDGVRVESDFGWWLVRASNTSSYLTTRCEGFSENDLTFMQNQLQNYLRI